MFGLMLVLAGSLNSCKENSLDALREDEVNALDKYVSENKLTDKKDISGLYFNNLETGTGDSIKSGYKVMLYFNITLLDGTVIFTTEDSAGRNYEEFAFYVDVSNTIVDASPIQKIAGLHTGLKKMKVGGKALMVIPSELAFKAVDNTATYGIPRFSTLLANVFVKKGYSVDQQK
jgi:FKBP-type peptidyl-prolyl cis-trans isomerase